MANLNRTTLIGRVGKPIELKKTNTGKSFAHMAIATNRRKTKENVEQKTDWHRVALWDKLAENCHKYLDVGSTVYVEGASETVEFETKDGEKKFFTQVSARIVEFLDKKKDTQ